MKKSLLAHVAIVAALALASGVASAQAPPTLNATKTINSGNQFGSAKTGVTDFSIKISGNNTTLVGLAPGHCCNGKSATTGGTAIAGSRCQDRGDCMTAGITKLHGGGSGGITSGAAKQHGPPKVRVLT